MKHRMFRTYAVSAIFIGLLAFPFLNDRLHLIKDMPNFENRALARKPVMDVNFLDPYPAEFEKFYNDSFALRARIIRGFNLYNILLLKKSPLKDVIIGKSNWLFPAGNDINSYLGKDSLTEKELQLFKQEFERRAAYLAGRHCKFYVMITPAKANIYSEYIPHTFRKLGKRGWGEQLISYMGQHSSVHMIDLYGVFREQKASHLLYYLTDNHWNDLGAFYAANAAVQNMSAEFPGLKPLSLSDFKVTKNLLGVGNIKQMVGNLDIYQDSGYALLPYSGLRAREAAKRNYPVSPAFAYVQEYERVREIKDTTQPRLLIFSDSFGTSIFPFLSEHFSRTVKIFDGWEYALHREMVEQEQPDVVLLMIQEPYIRNVFLHLTE